MSGLAVSLEGELWRSHMELSVTLRVLEGSWGGKWAINKGLPGSKKFAEGLRLQLHGEQVEESKEVCYRALGPAPFPAVL